MKFFIISVFFYYMNEIFKKIFKTDHIYCVKDYNHDVWECTGGFNDFMEADDHSAKENLEREITLIYIPNILPKVTKEIILKYQLNKRQNNDVIYKQKK